MVAKSCTTLDGWNPINNGMFTTYQLVLSSIHRVFLATCHWISFLPPSDRRRLMSSWWRSWSSWAAGHAMQPVHPKKNKPSGGFCWGRFCWVYVEFTLACSWMTFRPWATVQIWRLGQSWNSLWISQGFPIDFHKGTIISPRKRVQSSTEFWKWKKVRAPQLAEKVGDRNQDKRLATLRTFKKKNFGNSNFQILIL